MSEPDVEVVPRRGRGTEPDPSAGAAQDQPANWAAVTRQLRAGAGPFWLTTLADHGAPHVRPVFAAWAEDSFYVASNPAAVKSRNLRSDGRCSLGVVLDGMHLIVEGNAVRVTDAAGLRTASQAMRDVYDWPTEVVGERLDAPYAAPTSGGPPFDVYEIRPHKALGLPTADGFQPTRWTFRS